MFYIYTVCFRTDLPLCVGLLHIFVRNCFAGVSYEKYLNIYKKDKLEVV